MQSPMRIVDPAFQHRSSRVGVSLPIAARPVVVGAFLGRVNLRQSSRFSRISRWRNRSAVPRAWSFESTRRWFLCLRIGPRLVDPIPIEILSCGFVESQLGILRVVLCMARRRRNGSPVAGAGSLEPTRLWFPRLRIDPRLVGSIPAQIEAGMAVAELALAKCAASI